MQQEHGTRPPTSAQVGEAIERAKRHLSTKWAERAAYEHDVWHRLSLYAVKGISRPREFIEPLPGRPGWWGVGEIVRIGDGAVVYDVWLEAATMAVKVRQQPDPAPPSRDRRGDGHARRR